MNVSLKEAQEQLPQLLERVERGEQVTITRDGKPGIALSVSQKPARDPEAVQRAIAELDRLRQGNRLGTDLTVRQLIEEGRQ